MGLWLPLCPPANNMYPPPLYSTSPPKEIYRGPVNFPPPPPPPPPPIRPGDLQNGNEDYEEDSGFLLVGITCVCVAFLVAVSAYYLYVRWHGNRLGLREAEHRRPPRLRISRVRGNSLRASEDWFLASPREGLRRTIVDALPVFVYQPENFTDVLRCAVCLCEFQENEKAKLLPTCNHSFHVDCIDMWFYSHSTCPLCRARVDAQPVQMEISVIEEEADDKVSMSSTSDSEADEQHVPPINKNNGDSCEEKESGGHAAIDMPTAEN